MVVGEAWNEMIHKSLVRPAMRMLFLGALGLIFFPSICFADIGLPMLFIGVPMMLVWLIPIIVIETIVFRGKLKTNYVKTCGAVSLANVISTIFGYPLSWVLLLGLQLLTGRFYSIFGTKPLWFKIWSVTFGAAWMMPSESEMYWMVPIAGMVGMIPAFFISVYLEYLVILPFFSENKKYLLPLSWKANLITYLLLIGFLAWCLCSRFFEYMLKVL